MKKVLLNLCCIGLITSICSCSSSQSTAHIPAVKNFDLNRYMGKWYEIARLPHSFEENITNAYAEYTLMPDGNVQVINSGIRNNQLTQVTGQAKLSGENNRGDLQVTFFYPFYASYKIIYLNRDYTIAVVTSDTMDYLWILARQNSISSDELSFLLRLLREWGFVPRLLQYPSGIPGIADS